MMMSNHLRPYVDRKETIERRKNGQEKSAHPNSHNDAFFFLQYNDRFCVNRNTGLNEKDNQRRTRMRLLQAGCGDTPRCRIFVSVVIFLWIQSEGDPPERVSTDSLYGSIGKTKATSDLGTFAFFDKSTSVKNRIHSMYFFKIDQFVLV